MSKTPVVDDHYSAQYGQFAAEVHARVRRAAFGEDGGENSRLTRDELGRFGESLELGDSSLLLESRVAPAGRRFGSRS